jgi:hypothetical protein
MRCAVEIDVTEFALCVVFAIVFSLLRGNQDRQRRGF